MKKGEVKLVGEAERIARRRSVSVGLQIASGRLGAWSFCWAESFQQNRYWRRDRYERKSVLMTVKEADALEGERIGQVNRSSLGRKRKQRSPVETWPTKTHR